MVAREELVTLSLFIFRKSCGNRPGCMSLGQTLRSKLFRSKGHPTSYFAVFQGEIILISFLNHLGVFLHHILLSSTSVVIADSRMPLIQFLSHNLVTPRPLDVSPLKKQVLAVVEGRPPWSHCLIRLLILLLPHYFSPFFFLLPFSFCDSSLSFCS